MICPCCGFQPEKKDPRQLVDVIKFTKLERSLYRCFADRFGRWIIATELADATYSDDPAGGPEAAESAIGVRVMQIKKKIAPHGLMIENKMGPGGGRRMVWAADA